MAQLDTSKYNVKNNSNYSFAAFPDAKIYPDENEDGKWTQHLLFGDYISIVDLEVVNNHVKVKSRNKLGWIHINDLQKERVLEVNFVDIGQGDGCHLITPNDEHYLIDAGKGDNMYRYLYWRFNLDKNTALPFKFKALLSHPDNDHFLGFSQIFDAPAVEFDKIYHSGIVQRPKRIDKGWNTQLGKKEELSDGKDYITTLLFSDNEVKSVLSDDENLSGSGSQYCKTIFKTLNQLQDPEFIGLNSNDGFIVGDGSDTSFSLEVLSPILTNIDGKKALPYFGSQGKTKNGHSVLLKLKYKKLKVLLGGDINEEAGEYINACLGDEASDKLQVDIAKACHHGSHLFNYEFLEHVNALGTVISSGDDENYSHPRPDTLGAIGKTGYSKKPLIFSTELARSNKEFSTATIPELVLKYQTWERAQKDYENLLNNFVDTPENEQAIKALKEDATKKYKEINSYLTRHGMINLRSDGHKMIMAQKLEKDSNHGKYDIYEFEYSDTEKRFVRI